MTILEVRWRTGYWSLGVLLLEDDIKELIAYIGVASGVSEEYDANLIAEHGMKLSRIEAVGFFPEYANEIRHRYRLKNDGYI